MNSYRNFKIRGKMNKDYKRLFQNIGIFTLANFTSRFLSFLILPLYTAFLTTEEYGTIDLANTTVQLLFPIFSVTIVDAVLRFGLEENTNEQECLNIGLKIIIGGSLILAACLAVINCFLQDEKLLAFIFAIYVVQALNSLFAAFEKTIDKTKQMAAITTFTSFCILLLNVLFITVLHKGIVGYWISTIIGNSVGLVLYFLVCHLEKYVSFGFSIDKKLLKKMLLYSVPLIPNALFWWINSSLDRWALAGMMTMSVVGLYSCANKIPSILSTINTIFNQAWNLSLFQSSPNNKKSFFEDTYNFYNEVMFCCSIGIIWLSKFVAHFMFSKDFFQAWIFVPVLTCGAYVNSLNGVLGSLFTSEKKTTTIFKTTCIGSIVNITLNFLLIYLCGALGAAIATFVSYLVVWIMRVNKAAREFEINIDTRWSFLQLIMLITEVIFTTKDMLWGITTIFVICYCVIFLLHYGKVIKNKI